MKLAFYRLFLLLFSRKQFFPVWLALRKLSSHGLNMASAAQFRCDETGEQIAIAHVIANLQTDQVTIFDVGAHIGDYTDMCLRALSRQSKPFSIYTFEPGQAAYRSLLHRFEENRLVHLENVGASDEVAQKPLYLLWDRYAGASTQVDAVRNAEFDIFSEDAKFTTIDTYVELHNIDNISLLKIDVEGMEMRVLDGAQSSIGAGKISFIQFEISQATMLNKNYLYDFWTKLSDRYLFYLVLNQGLAEITEYNPHLENFANASNFLLARRAAGVAL